MKRIVSVVLVIALLAGLTVMFSACGDKREVLTVCNWGEYISDEDDGEEIFDVIKKFEEEYNVRVDYQLEETNESLYTKLKSGSVSYDVIFPSDYLIEQLISENMLAKLDFNNIPNFSNIMDRFKNLDYDPTNEYSVPYFWGTVGIIYNEDLVEGEVTSWDDLWTDKYPNMVLMFDNPRDAFAIAENKLGYSMNTTDENEIRAAAEELKKQKFSFVMDQIFTDMPANAAVLGPYYAGDYLTMAAENKSLKFVRPESGTNIFNDAMCVPATSEHKELAEKFINYMLRADVGLANTKALGYSTPNQAVYDLLDDETKNDEVAYPEIQENWEAFRMLPKETNELMRELWNEITTANK